VVEVLRNKHRANDFNHAVVLHLPYSCIYCQRVTQYNSYFSMKSDVIVIAVNHLTMSIGINNKLLILILFPRRKRDEALLTTLNQLEQYGAPTKF
jgi:hypothetical protein